MTHEEFLARVDELIPDVVKLIKEKSLEITKSDAVNFDDYESDYRLPKYFIAVMGREIERRFKPVYGNNRISREINNIYRDI